ncbi:MAG: hypothetical protein V1835_05130 [Candidatus Micrarchaeota archaeon]
MKKSVLPCKLFYQFNEVGVEKEDNFVLIKMYPRWGNIRKPPPKDFDPSPVGAICKASELGDILGMIGALDLMRYRNAKDSDFGASPPDLAHAEFLKIAIDDEVAVCWGRNYAMLQEPLRRPLLAINDLLERKLALLHK